MLRFSPETGSRHCDGYSRRDLLGVGALALGGLTLPGLLRLRASVPASAARARSVVVLYLSGGPSQLDMWDMKPDAPREIRGDFRPVPTNVPGVHICEHLPRMARIADRYTIIRSMSHDESDHIKAGYRVLSGRRLDGSLPQGAGMERRHHPHFGSVMSHLLGEPPRMPAFVTIPEFVSPVGVARPGQHAGFLGPAHDPFLVDSDPNLPEYSPGPLSSRRDVPQERLLRRRGLLAGLERGLRGLEERAEAESWDAYHAKALELVSSPAAREAFDLSSEPEATRDRYGRHVFGQSVLVARRLVEAGVRLVQVNFVRHDNGKGGQGYDSHSVPPNPPHLAWARSELLPPTDAAFASLIEDLDERGLLDETLVLLFGEFGRTPRFNKDGGRDHWPGCYSLVAAGAGLPGGHVHGASDRLAAAPISDPVSPEALLATVYRLVGIDPGALIRDREGRPYRLVEEEPVEELIGAG